MTFHKNLLTQNKNSPLVIKGAGVQRYFTTKNMSQGVIEYLDESKYLKENKGSKSKDHRYERIGMQGITGVDDERRLIMTIIDKGNYLANSCNYILPLPNISLRSLLVLLNSKLINWYFKKTSTNSNVNCYEIENIPIIQVEKEFQKKIEDIFFILEFVYKSQYPSANIFDQIADALVFNLYFSDHMKTNNIDVIDYIEQDLQKVLKGRNFEDLSDSDKQAVITQLQKEWTDPNNEVVKRMAQFKTKSPDILKPILES